jgi:hypothetical protein
VGNDLVGARQSNVGEPRWPAYQGEIVQEPQMKPLTIAATGLVLVVLCYTAGAGATTVRRVAIDELATAASVIVHARVANVNPSLAPTPQGPFQTEVAFEVLESVKGLPADSATLTLVLPGGRGFGRTMHVPGVPQFAPGDEVVLLLERTSRGLVPAGLGQGVFRVLPDASGTLRVERDLGAVNEVGPLTFAAVPATLPALLTRLRALAQGGTP